MRGLHPLHRRKRGRNAAEPGQSPGQQSRLIVAALAQTARVERDRNEQQVGFARRHQTQHLLCHQQGEVCAGGMFEAEEDGDDRPLIAKGGARTSVGRRRVQACPAPGGGGHLDVERQSARRAARVRQKRELLPAGQAEAPILADDVAAGGAARRQNQVEKGVGSAAKHDRDLTGFARGAYMRARMKDDENRIAPFDRNARRRARERAVRGYGTFAFLKDAVSEDLAGRAAGFDRRWERCLDLGAHDGRLGARIGAGTLIATDSAYGFAAPLLGVVCDEDRLPFAEGSFDIVVSALSLHSVNDLPGALVQVRRLLRPGGVFLAAFVGGASFAAQRSALLHAEMDASGGASPRLLPMVDPAEAPGLMQRAGFVDPVVDQHRVTVKYRRPQDMVRDLRGMGETNVLAARERVPLGRGRAAALLSSVDPVDSERIEAHAEILTLTGKAPEAPQR